MLKVSSIEILLLVKLTAAALGHLQVYANLCAALRLQE